MIIETLNISAQYGWGRSPGRDWWNASALQPWQGVSFQLFSVKQWPRTENTAKGGEGTGRRNRGLYRGDRAGQGIAAVQQVRVGNGVVGDRDIFKEETALAAKRGCGSKRR